MADFGFKSALEKATMTIDLDSSAFDTAINDALLTPAAPTSITINVTPMVIWPMPSLVYGPFNGLIRNHLLRAIDNLIARFVLNGESEI